MNYAAIYEKFVSDRRANEAALLVTGGYTERHHIQPRCLGGGNEPENIISLTPGDHFFAHLLLAKIHGGRMWYALNALIAGAHIGERDADRRFTRRARHYYARIKLEFSLAHSARMKGRFTGEEHPMYGRPCSPVALEKLKARIAAGFNPMASDEARAKVSARLKGRTFTAETRAKISATKTGVALSDETRAKMSASHTGKKRSPEAVAKIAAAHRGRKRPAESIEKMRRALTGRRLSPEHAAKCAAKLANASRMRGKKHSLETRQRMSAVNQARKAYAAQNGCDSRKVTLEQMRASGLNI